MRLTPEAEVGLTALVGAVIAWGAAWLKGKIEARRVQQGEAAVIDAAEVYTILAEHARAINADRVLLLYTSNGGGIPTAGKPLYTTILYEIANNHNAPIMERFQGVLADAGYVHMVASVAEYGQWRSDPEQMEPGFLRTLYEEEGVQQALIVRIGTTAKRFYFLSAKWISSAPPSDEALDLYSRSVVARLRPLLSAAP